MIAPGVSTTNTSSYLFRYYFVLLFTILCSVVSRAQISFDGFPEFGNFQRSEMELKQVDFEPDASAVVLFDAARASYDDEHHLITSRRIRLKILNDKGKDRATITIPFYHYNDYEFVNNVKAVISSFDNNNAATQIELPSKDIHYSKINNYWSEVKFTMPNVQPGSIVEYQYVSIMKSYMGLDEWVFQSDIPTIKSWYKLDIIPHAEFAYMVKKVAHLPITIDNKTMGTISFEMNHIPSLTEEAYMDSRKDNLQRVTFQLFSYNAGGYKSKYLNKWDDVSYELLSQPYLGGQLSKSIPNTDDFIKKTKALSSGREKITAVYQFVQQHMSWDGFNAKYSTDGIKKAWEKQKGSNGEINMIFINLLRDVGIDAVPLLVSDRSHQKVDLTYPYIDQFNRLVSYVYLQNENFVVDAADIKTPWYLAPVSLLNTFGYIVDKKRKGAIFIESDHDYYESVINVVSLVSNEGVISGNANVMNRSYGRLDRSRDQKLIKQDKFIEKYYLENGTDLKVEGLEIKNLEADSLPLEQTFEFKQTLNQSGEFSFLNYHLFDGMRKNPFTAANRFSDINLAYPRRIMLNSNIEIPENYTVDFLPKGKILITPDTSLLLRRSITQTGNTITCQLKLEIKKTYYDRNEYAALKNFYKLLYDLLDEQIVLKAKK